MSGIEIRLRGKKFGCFLPLARRAYGLKVQADHGVILKAKCVLAVFGFSPASHTGAAGLVFGQRTGRRPIKNSYRIGGYVSPQYGSSIGRQLPRRLGS
jgi:hypothetical protein